jgi:hypothetical protein
MPDTGNFTFMEEGEDTPCNAPGAALSRKEQGIRKSQRPPHYTLYPRFHALLSALSALLSTNNALK